MNRAQAAALFAPMLAAPGLLPTYSTADRRTIAQMASLLRGVTAGHKVMTDHAIRQIARRAMVDLELLTFHCPAMDRAMADIVAATTAPIDRLPAIELLRGAQAALACLAAPIEEVRP